VQVAGRPAHEGLFKIPGQPVAGRPAMLRARVTREHVTDAIFDLVSMNGARLQALELSPVTASSTEEEYVGEIANLPSVPFRVRVSGRDRTGAVYQRFSGPSFHAATVEVIALQTVTLTRGQQTPVTVSVRNVGAPARLQIVAVLNATVLRVEPATLQLSANESRDVTVWADVPTNGTLLSSEIVVSAESPTDPAAANSAIIPATLDRSSSHVPDTSNRFGALRASAPQRFRTKARVEGLSRFGRNDDVHGFCPAESCSNLLFSQMFSIRFSPGARTNGKTTFHGFPKTSGSSYVTSTVIVPIVVRVHRSLICMFAVCGSEGMPSHDLSLNPIESTTSVSPSHVPIECPIHVGSMSDGCGRPSRNTNR
jgi:hypothetical protein